MSGDHGEQPDPSVDEVVAQENVARLVARSRPDPSLDPDPAFAARVADRLRAAARERRAAEGGPRGRGPAGVALLAFLGGVVTTTAFELAVRPAHVPAPVAPALPSAPAERAPVAPSVRVVAEGSTDVGPTDGASVASSAIGAPSRLPAELASDAAPVPSSAAAEVASRLPSPAVELAVEPAPVPSAATVAARQEEPPQLAGPPAPDGPGPARARPRPASRPAEPAHVGAVVETTGRRRRRLLLDDGSTLFVDAGSVVRLLGPRRLRLERGELFVDVAVRPDDPFVVETGDRAVTAVGTRFAVRAGAAGAAPEVLVAHGRVQLGDELVPAGWRADLRTGERRPLGPASRVLEWTRDLQVAACSPLVAGAPELQGPAIVVRDATGQEASLPLRRQRVDVVVEGGFARTAIDLTFFNRTWQRLEGTFRLPLPPDASISRLAMYCEGKLMEGACVERERARDVFETIRHQRRDPALLEWLDGSVFKLRIFPLEPRQEKRVVLCYTQRLPAHDGGASLRLLGGAAAGVVGKLDVAIRVRGGAHRLGWPAGRRGPGRPPAWGCRTHELGARADGADLVLEHAAKDVLPEGDLVLDLPGPDPAAPRTSLVEGTGDAELLAHSGWRYLAARVRCDLPVAPRPARRAWIVVVETSADRDPLLARTAIDAARGLLAHAGPDDLFALLAASTRTTLLTGGSEAGLQPTTPVAIDGAIAALEKAHLIGALDLGAALDACAPAVAAARAAGCEPWLVQLGTALPVLGERDPAKLLARAPEGARVLGIGVGRRWNQALLRRAAAATGGHAAQLHPDEPVAWRAGEIASSLDAPRLLDVRVDAPGAPAFLVDQDALESGRELFALTRVRAADAVPGSVVVRGILNGRPWEQTVLLGPARPGPLHLARTWGRLEVDRLVATNDPAVRAQVVQLGTSLNLITPFTSLLVLESEAMHRQYSVPLGSREHWAPYDLPATVPVVTEHEERAPTIDGRAPRGGRRPADQVLATVLLRGTQVTLFGARVSDDEGPWWFERGPELPNGSTEALVPDANGNVIDRRRAMSSIFHRSMRRLEETDYFYRTKEVPLGDDGEPDYDDSQDVPLFGQSMFGGRLEHILQGGRAYLSKNRLNAASDLGDLAKELSLSEREHQALSRDYLRLGLQDYEAFDYRAAAAKFKRAVDADPNDIEARRLLLQTQLLAGDRRAEFESVAAMTGRGRRLAEERQLASMLLREQARAPRRVTLRDRGQLDEAKRPPSPTKARQLAPGKPETTDAVAAAPPDPIAAAEERLADAPNGHWHLGGEWTPSLREKELGLGAAGTRVSPLAHLFRPGPSWASQARLAYLTAFAPGLGTTWADLDAVVDAEAEPAPVLGRVDPAARALVDRARRADWERVELEHGFAVRCDGAGRFLLERRTPLGLIERVLSDGRHLVHAYPELGLAARRVQAPAYECVLRAVVPWAVASADDLARDADLELADAATVRVVPRDPAAPVDLLLFAGDRLVERRRVDRAGQASWTERYDRSGGSVVVARGAGGEAPRPTRTLEVERCKAPLLADLRPGPELLVLALPWRDVEWPVGKRDLDGVDEPTALAWIGGALARSDVSPHLGRFVRARFLDRGDRRLGWYALLSGTPGWSALERGGLLDGRRWVLGAGAGAASGQWTAGPTVDAPAAWFAVQGAAWSASRALPPVDVPGAAPGSFLARLALVRHVLARRQAGGGGAAWVAGAGAIELIERLAVDEVTSPLALSLALEAACAAPGSSLPITAPRLDALLVRLGAVTEVGDADVAVAIRVARHALARSGTPPADPARRRALAVDVFECAAARAVAPPLDDALLGDLGPEAQARLLAVARSLVAAGQRREAFLWAAQLDGRAATVARLAAQVRATAREGATPGERLELDLHDLARLVAGGKDDLVDRLATELLDAPDLDPGIEAVVCRLGAGATGRLGRTARALTLADRAFALEDRLGEELVDLVALRARTAELLGWAAAVADACRRLDAPPPADLAARVVRAVDRLRALEPDPAQLCLRAASLLRGLGHDELAWDYAVSPVALRPAEAAPWAGLARSLAAQEPALAARAFAAACAAEPTDGDLLLERCRHLLGNGARDEARPLLEHLAASGWQPRFAPAQAQARGLLDGWR